MKMTVEVPKHLANAAKAAGLWKKKAIETMLEETLRRKTLDVLWPRIEEIRAANIPPMSMEEIQEMVDEVRQERRVREQAKKEEAKNDAVDT